MSVVQIMLDKVVGAPRHILPIESGFGGEDGVDLCRARTVTPTMFRGAHNGELCSCDARVPKKRVPFSVSFRSAEDRSYR